MVENVESASGLTIFKIFETTQPSDLCNYTVIQYSGIYRVYSTQTDQPVAIKHRHFISSKDFDCALILKHSVLNIIPVTM
jgi:hypothetical protein